MSKKIKEDVCSVCGKPKDSSKHIKYGSDLDNPAKHEFVSLREESAAFLKDAAKQRVLDAVRQARDVLAAIIIVHPDYEALGSAIRKILKADATLRRIENTKRSDMP